MQEIFHFLAAISNYDWTYEIKYITYHLIQHTQNILIQQVINEKNISEMFLHDCYWY